MSRCFFNFSSCFYICFSLFLLCACGKESNKNGSNPPNGHVGGSGGENGYEPQGGGGTGGQSPEPQGGSGGEGLGMNVGGEPAPAGGEGGEGGGFVEPSNANILIGLGPDEGRAREQAIGRIRDIELDSDGNVWFTDEEHYLIRKYNPNTGTLTTEYGTGNCVSAYYYTELGFKHSDFPQADFTHCHWLYSSGELEIIKDNIIVNHEGDRFDFFTKDSSASFEVFFSNGEGGLFGTRGTNVTFDTLTNRLFFLVYRNDGISVIASIDDEDFESQGVRKILDQHTHLGMDGWCTSDNRALPCIPGPLGSSRLSMHPDGDVLVLEPSYGCIRKISPNTWQPHTWIGPCVQPEYTDPNENVDINLGEGHGYRFNDVTVDAEDRAWVATNRGLFIIEDGEFKEVLGSQDALPNGEALGSLQKIELTEEGHLWILPSEPLLFSNNSRLLRATIEEQVPLRLHVEEVLSSNPRLYPQSDYGDPKRIAVRDKPLSNALFDAQVIEADSSGNVLFTSTKTQQMHVVTPLGTASTLVGGANQRVSIADAAAALNNAQPLQRDLSSTSLDIFRYFVIKEHGVDDSDEPYWDLFTSIGISEDPNYQSFWVRVEGLRTSGNALMNVLAGSAGDYAPEQEGDPLMNFAMRDWVVGDYDRIGERLYTIGLTSITTVDFAENPAGDNVRTLLGPANPDDAQGVPVPQPRFAIEDIEDFDDPQNIRVKSLSIRGGDSDNPLLYVVLKKYGAPGGPLTFVFRILLSPDAQEPITRVLEASSFEVEGDFRSVDDLFIKVTEEGHLWISNRFGVYVLPEGQLDQMQKLDRGEFRGDLKMLSESSIDHPAKLDVVKLGENRWQLHVFDRVGGRIRSADIRRNNEGVFDGVLTTTAGMVDSPNMGPLAFAELHSPRAFVRAAVQNHPETYFIAGGKSQQLFRVQLGEAQKLDAVAGYANGFTEPAWQSSSRFSRLLNNGAGVAFTTNHVDEISNVAQPLIFFTEKGSNDLRFINYNTPVGLGSWVIGTLIKGAAGLDNRLPEQRIEWLRDIRLDEPTDLYFDQDADVLFVADTGNHVIRGLDFQNNRAFIAAGMIDEAGFPNEGAQADATPLHSPAYLTKDANGNLWMMLGDQIALKGIYKKNQDGSIEFVYSNLNLGNVECVEGRHPLSGACLKNPRGMAFDEVGNLYVTDGSRLWKVYPEADGQEVTSMSDAEIIFSADQYGYPLNNIECLSDVDIVADKARLIDECSGIMFEVNLRP